jgi:hypothetical protein
MGAAAWVLAVPVVVAGGWQGFVTWHSPRGTYPARSDESQLITQSASSAAFPLRTKCVEGFLGSLKLLRCRSIAETLEDSLRCPVKLLSEHAAWIVGWEYPVVWGHVPSSGCSPTIRK